jgi:CrcB protein
MRYLLTGLVHRVMAPGFPYGTLTVNLIGSLVVGFASGVFAARAQSRDHLVQLFLIVGVCGGFTTFSAFSAETYRLVEQGAVAPAALNVALQVAGSLVAVFAGFWLSRQV